MKAGVLAEPVLVGRERELEELMRCLDSAVEGKGTTVFISGEAGSGKTRLAREFLDAAKKRGVGVMAGWCLSDAAAPYFPFVEAFNAYFASSDEEPVSLQKPGAPFGLAGAARIVSEERGITAWLTGQEPAEKPGKPQVISPQVWKDQVFAGVAKTLHAVSAQNPVILFIEDIHWADSASLALLHYVARVINNSEKILVLATFRSEELTADAEGRPHPLAETLRIMRREDLFAEITLSSLSQASVAKMAENMIGGSLQQEFAEELARESRGNPLFVVESLRMLHERKSLFQENNEWRLSVGELGVPNKIKDIILRRLATLKYAQRRILDAASVIGEEFNVELLSTVLGQDSLGVLEALNVIAQSTSIVCVEEAFYRFDHARSREVLYEALSLPLKRGYHARIAERLEAPSKSNRLPFADLAYHYARAQNEEKAVKYSLAAGKEELARWSNTEAAKHFQYVLQRIGDNPERFNERMIALEGLGDAYYASDNFSQAASVFDQLAGLQSGASKLRALRKAMFAAYYLGDIPLLAKLTQKAEENATADRLESGRVLHQKARVSVMMQNDITTCRRLSEEALKIFEEEYALSDAAWILFTIGATSADEQYERGVAAALRSIALYDELGDILSQMEAYLYTGMTFHGFGLVEEGMRMYEKVIRLNEQLRLGDYIRLIGAYAFLSLGLMRADVPSSISKALKALEYAEKTDSSLYIGLIYALLTVEYAFAEDSVRMEEYFGKLMSLPKNVLSMSTSRNFLKPTMGVYYAAKNEFEKSNQYFSEVFQDPLRNPRAYPMAKHAYSWALSRQGRMDEAESQLEQLKKILEIGRDRFSHVNVQASLMTLTHPEVDQVFEMRLDLVNVSKSQGSIVGVENLIVPGLTVTKVPPNCLVHDEIVEFKDKTINSFEVKTVKLTVEATKPGVFQLHPTVTYFDDLGETKTSSTRTFTINVHPMTVEAQAVGRVRTGSADLDRLLLGGFPEGYAIALTSPPFDERLKLIERYVAAGPKNGQITFYLTADPGSTKVLAEEFPSSMYLFVCNARADLMVKDLPNVYKLKGVDNLTDIDIALAKASRQLDSSRKSSRRACIEIVSDALLQHHAVNTRKWLSGLIQDLKSKSFTILAVINPQMHPPEEAQAILDLFDGEVRVSERETARGTEEVLRVRKLAGQKYLEKELVLNIQDWNHS